MPFLTTPLRDLLIFEPRVFGDSRGNFFESYNERVFREEGIDCHFVQDNQAISTRGVLRGMHLQTGQHAQTKLVRVVEGEVFDAVIDLRPESPTYMKWHGIYLSAENNRQLFVPRGFAHGYLVTSDRAVFQYKCDNFYAPESEFGIQYNDPSIGIQWPVAPEGYLLADRDYKWPALTSKPEPLL